MKKNEKTNKRFTSWKFPVFNKKNITRWNWMCQYHKHLVLGKNTDIGAFTDINAKYGVYIGKDVQIGSHCSIYSESTIDEKTGKVVIEDGARIGTHSTIMPGVHIGKEAIIGAYSFVKRNIPAHSVAYGIPARIAKP